MNSKSLEHGILDLPSRDRARLALDLIESLETLPADELEDLWAQEAQRRIEQIDAGLVALIPADEVSVRAHSLFR